MLQNVPLRYFLFEGLRYIWLDKKGAFCRVLNPFYVFQVFSIILWSIDDYYVYAICIFILSIISISISLYETRKQSVILHNMARLVTNVTIRRNSGVEECVNSLELVPGDCLIIPQEGLLLPCDAALLAGECLVNESMLTGESLPVLKTPLLAGERKFSSESERRHTLFCGTQLIQAKGGGLRGDCAIAVVTSTGFFTAKGNLVSSILYPQPINFRFYRDAAIFLIILAGAAVIGTIYSIVVLFRAKVTVAQLVIRSLDIVTIVVPPALPAALTAGTIYAQNRLKRHGVFCISPPRINVFGKVSLCCFDKVLDAEFGHHKVLAVMRPPAPHLQSISEAVAIVQRFPFSSALQRMSVVTVACEGRSAFAFIKGSPEMVVSLCRAETVPEHFSSKLHSFSSEGLRVLALGYKPLDSKLHVNATVFVHREEVEKDMQFLGLLMMKNLVKPESANVINTLRLAHLRSVMATGDNILTAVNVAKSCGMILSKEKVIFVNATPHTDESRPTLMFSLEDEEASGTQSSIITQVGRAQTQHSGSPNQNLSPRVLMRATVFARMLPDQKTQLVKEFQKLNYRVSMCGDGANDCGALQAADVGVSLSEAEASVASTFTSKTENISCVPLLIREGRCSLVTSFSVFRYMALYSLIQFCSVLILYTMHTTLGDWQFLFFDLPLVTLLVFVMGKGGPSNELHPCRPPASLLSLPVLASIFLHTCMIFLGQLGALLITTSQDWYIPLNSTVFGKENLPNMENFSVFGLSGFQYIIIAVVVTKGYPHKKPLYYNVIFLILVFILFALMTVLVVFHVPFLSPWLQLYNIPDMNFKMLLIAVAALNLLTCFIVEVSEYMKLFNSLLWSNSDYIKTVGLA
uniref:ATPase cation transporting 13A2 n=1 Tax=Mastacembelus armatus TaxID=205130 RepID=A0A7N8XU92_9TELE